MKPPVRYFSNQHTFFKLRRFNINFFFSFVVTIDQMRAGFQRVYDEMNEISLDVPAAFLVLERWVIRCRQVLQSRILAASLAESPECWNMEFQQVEICRNFFIFADNSHIFGSEFFINVDKHKVLTNILKFLKKIKEKNWREKKSSFLDRHFALKCAAHKNSRKRCENLPTNLRTFS